MKWRESLQLGVLMNTGRTDGAHRT